MELFGSPQNGSISSKSNNHVYHLSLFFTNILKQFQFAVKLALALIYDPLIDKSYDEWVLFLDMPAKFQKTLKYFLIERFTIDQYLFHCFYGWTLL